MSQAQLHQNSTLLCDRCKQMTTTMLGLQSLASKEGYRHLVVEEIHKSANRGCPLCIIIRGAQRLNYNRHIKGQIRIFPRGPSTRYEGRAYRQIFPKEPVSAEYKLLDWVIQTESKGHPFEIAKLTELYCAVDDANVNVERASWNLGYVRKLIPFTGAGDPAENFLNIRNISISVTGSEMIQELKILLADCCNSHSNCPKPGGANLPSRVIDVGQGEHNTFVRLHITHPEERASYLALSYRWGGPQGITTTTANLPHWKVGISVAALPLTLQDAIALTRDLGFRYLWVDSLCIIQDDSADKVTEINRMGMVYKNATLTIAAASTNNARESFLAERPLPSTCTVPYLLPNGTFGNLWIMDGDPDSLMSPLDSRAWAFQESELSPRLLWYGPADVKWKCETIEFKDVCKTHTIPIRYSNSKRKRLPRSVFGFTQPLGIDMPAQQSKVWIEIVEEYSLCDITFPEDRLPALAGIALELQNLWQDDYLAGMWRRCLIKHLGWEVFIGPPPELAEDNSLNLHLPLAYRSPGWSWASYTGQVRINEVIYEHAEVIECSVTLVDSTAPLSQVRDGRLILSAACIDEGQRLAINSQLGQFTWDYKHCDENENVNREFRYALLGYEKLGLQRAIALILAPVGDGMFMRIGVLSSFSTTHWPVEALERRIITII